MMMRWRLISRSTSESLMIGRKSSVNNCFIVFICLSIIYLVNLVNLVNLAKVES